MTHDEFLLLHGPDWIEIQDANDLVYSWGEESILTMINSQSWGELDGIIEAAGHLPPGMTVSNGKAFRDGSNFRLWVVFSPLT
jgi:hypothetical protein